jgi:hypothetical protein
MRSRFKGFVLMRYPDSQDLMILPLQGLREVVIPEAEKETAERSKSLILLKPDVILSFRID